MKKIIFKTCINEIKDGFSKKKEIELKNECTTNLIYFLKTNNQLFKINTSNQMKEINIKLGNLTNFKNLNEIHGTHSKPNELNKFQISFFPPDFNKIKDEFDKQNENENKNNVENEKKELNEKEKKKINNKKYYKKYDGELIIEYKNQIEKQIFNIEGRVYFPEIKIEETVIDFGIINDIKYPTRKKQFLIKNVSNYCNANILIVSTVDSENIEKCFNFSNSTIKILKNSETKIDINFTPVNITKNLTIEKKYILKVLEYPSNLNFINLTLKGIFHFYENIN
jgi:hypothetical protein